jgi:hypothetical protein
VVALKLRGGKKGMGRTGRGISFYRSQRAVRGGSGQLVKRRCCHHYVGHYQERGRQHGRVKAGN